MQSPEPEAHDKVLDNPRSNWNLKMLVFEERGKLETPNYVMLVRFFCLSIWKFFHVYY